MLNTFLLVYYLIQAVFLCCCVRVLQAPSTIRCGRVGSIHTDSPWRQCLQIPVQRRPYRPTRVTYDFSYHPQTNCTLTSDGYIFLPYPWGQLILYSDSLRAGRSGDRIPVGARFSAPVQTGPGAHPASCTMATGSFQGLKRPGRGADHPPPSKRRGHERVELYLYLPYGASWPVIGKTSLYLSFLIP